MNHATGRLLVDVLHRDIRARCYNHRDETS